MLTWLVGICLFEFNLANQLIVPPCQTAYVEGTDDAFVQQIDLYVCGSDATSATSVMTECIESTDPFASNCQ